MEISHINLAGLVCFSLFSAGGALVFYELLPLWTVGIWMILTALAAAVADTEDS